MKPPFEKWVEDHDHPEEAEVAFREAVVCFKAGAYRASLVFSYLGLLLSIRQRLLSAGPPTDVPQGQWADLQARMRNDDDWDAATFDATQMKRPSPAFAVSDSVRHQMAYWRARRNDCAHSKANGIDHSHTESLWLFITSNLSKFAVIGSSQSLLARVERHLDPTYTAPGTDAAPLVEEIPSAVEPRDLPAFLADLDQRASTAFGRMRFRGGGLIDFYSTALQRGSSGVVAALTAFLSSDEALLVDFLRARPEHLVRFASDAALMRRLWTTHLFSSGRNDFGLLVALVRNQVIATAEGRAVSRTIVPKLRGAIPSDADLAVLEGLGFFEAFEEYAFKEAKLDRFEWGNPNAALISWFVERCPITSVVVDAVRGNFQREPCAETVRAALDDLFRRSPAKKAEFLEVLAAKGEPPPKLIPSLAS